MEKGHLNIIHRKFRVCSHSRIMKVIMFNVSSQALEINIYEKYSEIEINK